MGKSMGSGASSHEEGDGEDEEANGAAMEADGSCMADLDMTAEGTYTAAGRRIGGTNIILGARLKGGMVVLVVGRNGLVAG